MIYNLFLINALLSICETSAVFHLHSMNTTSKSLDTCNQSKITLNNIWNYKDDDPITLSATRRQDYTRQNGKLLLNATAAAAPAATTIKTLTNKRKRLAKYLSNQKPLKMSNTVRQREPKQHHRNTNHFHNYLTTLTFNNANIATNHYDNCNLDNKLKRPTAYAKNDAKEIVPNLTDVKGSASEQRPVPAQQKENENNLKIKHQTKYYPADNSFSNDWLGQLPQFQLQLLLQQQMLRHTSSSSASASASASLLPMAAAALLPYEYRLFFNAERHTHFYLHTLTTQNDFVTAAIKPATATATATATARATATLPSFQEPDANSRHKNNYNYNYNNQYGYAYDYNYGNRNDTDNDGNDNDVDNELDDDNAQQTTNLTNARVLNIIADKIASAFGVNTRPGAAIHGIQIEEIELYNGLSLRQSRFNPFNPCRILIHGWLGGSKAGMYNTLVPEYFKLEQGAYNIITIDWGKGAISDYVTASYRVKPVGITVAKFIDFLHQESGIRFENIHVIGFSMGAHVAGIAGKNVQSGRLPVIYGLDPALPLFHFNNVMERLDASDANYVEVLHTSAGSYGYHHPVGHVDFYINFGYNQPGCFFNECSHFRAFKVYAQSLKNEILRGVECLKDLWWNMIKYKRCSRQMKRTLRMGVEGLNYREISSRRGVYYMITNAEPPYKVI